MSNQILVPSLGESVTEATVAKWLVQVGDKVDADQEVVELETDKVNLSCSSPCSGIIESIKIQEGSTVEPGTFSSSPLTLLLLLLTSSSSPPILLLVCMSSVIFIRM